jgi:transcription-repair coupling factor (superfamily II helicase)
MKIKKPEEANLLKLTFSALEESAFFEKVVENLRQRNYVSVKPHGRLFTEILTTSLLKKNYSPIIFISENEDEIFYTREEIETISGHKAGLFYSFDDEESINLDEIEDRFLTLEGILTGALSFIITNTRGLTLPIPSDGELKKNRIQLTKDTEYRFTSLVEKLHSFGFNRVKTVGEIGEFSIRGSIIDIFGYGMDFPKRIEFFGDHIESLRSFDPFTQKTIRSEEGFVLLPISEESYTSNSHSLLDLLPRHTLFVYPEFLFIENHTHTIPELRNKNQVVLSNDGMDAGILRTQEFYGNLPRFKDYLKKIRNSRIFICCESEEERKRCEYLFEDEFPSLSFETLNVCEGFESYDWKIHVITDKEIFGKGYHPRRFEKKEITFKPERISELKPGDFVVHEDYGIGIFENLGKVEHKGHITECLRVKYAGNDILYVPIGAMPKVSKYVGLDKGLPMLSHLSSLRWEKKKKNARKAIKEMTDDLIHLYAERELSEGFRFSQDTVWQKELEASFQYEETHDQLSAVQDIKKDMESKNPMDRLVCGEVGYGKTEVAIRAAFKAVMDSKQVLLLAPTTILCEQHYNTFKERLSQFPVKIEMLSRFVKKSKQKVIIENIKNGEVDIIIGTHKLLGKELTFSNPGLLIIDEEHRFGVSQKEKLKNKRKDMDVLSMSATPIPRTLQFSLLDIRDFSTIETPPEGRLSVITRIIHFNSGFIRDVILNEMKRGGQIYYVFNRIQGLDAIAKKIGTLVPEARITVTHGRMKPSVIERRMRDFLTTKYTVLVTTSIIESGLDIPNVNTIIIDRADLYGLAQLHQLRGRVGRSNRRAYCYLIVPKRISHEARKRLSTVYTHSHLGSGLALALKDLEIRGAGNLLGRKQHGHISSIGYDLYMKLLQEAIQDMKGKKKAERVHTEVYSNLTALLPSFYIQDVNSRIEIYKRLSSAMREGEVDEIALELKDRFGTLPDDAERLLLVTKVKIVCSRKQVKKVYVDEHEMELSFDENRFPSKKDIETLFKAVDKKFIIDYSERIFKIRFKIVDKKILKDLKKVLKFL